MPSPRGLSLSGARASFMIDGKKIAYTTSCSVSEEIRHEPIEALDNFAVEEHVPVGYYVTLSAQWVRIIKSSIKNKDGLVIMPELEKILEKGDMTVTIEDKTTGAVLANVEGVRASRYSWSIGARNLAMVDVEFVAVRIRTENELA